MRGDGRGISDDGYRRKGVQKRDFLKRLKFELSGVGGFYASDVLSSTYTYGGALAFFPAEDFGLEVMVTRAKVEFKLEEPFSSFDRTRRFQGGNAWQAQRETGRFRSKKTNSPIFSRSASPTPA